jgi:hypothetical protein
VQQLCCWLIAFMKIFATRTFYAPSGIDLTERVATIPQAERAAFIGLGGANWKTWSLRDDRAIANVLSSNLKWHIVTVVIAARAEDGISSQSDTRPPARQSSPGPVPGSRIIRRTARVAGGT